MRRFIIVLLPMVLAACFRASGPSTHWRDGNYRVYSRPVSGEVIMGYYMGDGGILGLSEPTVTAAGSDARFVVFRRETDKGETLFYYIEKKPNREGEVTGPFSAEEYLSSCLPGLAWSLP